MQCCHLCCAYSLKTALDTLSAENLLNLFHLTPLFAHALSSLVSGMRPSKDDYLDLPFQDTPCCCITAMVQQPSSNFHWLLAHGHSWRHSVCQGAASHTVMC